MKDEDIIRQLIGITLNVYSSYKLVNNRSEIKDAHKEIINARDRLERIINCFNELKKELAIGTKQKLQLAVDSIKSLIVEFDNYNSSDEGLKSAIKNKELYEETSREMRRGGIASMAEYSAEMIDLERIWNLVDSYREDLQNSHKKIAEMCEQLFRDFDDFIPKICSEVHLINKQ